MNECRRHLWRGLSVGFIVAGIMLGAMGMLLYNWLSDTAGKLEVALAIASNPEYLAFIDKLADAMSNGRDVVISSEEASSLYPLASSIRTQIAMINIGRGGAISNILILAGIAMAGIGVGWAAGLSLASRDRRGKD